MFLLVYAISCMLSSAIISHFEVPVMSTKFFEHDHRSCCVWNMLNRPYIWMLHLRGYRLRNDLVRFFVTLYGHELVRYCLRLAETVEDCRKRGKDRWRRVRIVGEQKILTHLVFTPRQTRHNWPNVTVTITLHHKMVTINKKILSNLQ